VNPHPKHLLPHESAAINEYANRLAQALGCEWVGLWEYDILLNVHMIDAARWDDERRYRGTLWREIDRDGVPLRPDTLPAATAAR